MKVTTIVTMTITYKAKSIPNVINNDIIGECIEVTNVIGCESS